VDKFGARFSFQSAILHPNAIAMNIEQYKSDSARTLIDKGYDMNLLHAAMGIGTEAGELLDAFKRKIFYGKELDVVNVKEEIGDIMWYIAILLRELDLDFEDILQLNIDKLRARFPDKFTENHALNRDLDAERKILESGK
jgi:NTP pyrophosphatase (non-canonical NTP hydrolase)